ncbi:helix-turn-helix domain-containing protein [Horticoccus sp. 23ND18S-11]|uniref:helix-turn-helix domain-containing protein n=1 Tax=Horticoccus sp. 23ND18S-11 TaxID=3391832 RepID=UPI0039C91C20
MASPRHALTIFRSRVAELLTAVDELRHALETAAGDVRNAPGDVKLIQKIVAAEFAVDPRLMVGRKRDALAAPARMVAMALSEELTGHTLACIGAAFDRDHGTVIHARHAIEGRCATESRFAHKVTLAREKCRAALGEKYPGTVPALR